MSCNDWEWIYINGETSDTEGSHSYELENTLDMLNNFIHINEYNQIKNINAETLYINDGYIEKNAGECPRLLSDIPEDVFD